MTAWTALLLAGAFEVLWAFGLKQTDGFTRFWPSVGTLAATALSFGCMAIALRSIPFATAYAVWCGIGVAGTVIVGVIAFGEPTTAIRLLCVALIAAGIIGLKLAGRDSRFYFNHSLKTRSHENKIPNKERPTAAEPIFLMFSICGS